MAYGNLLADVVQGSTSNTPPIFRDGSGVEAGRLCRAWVQFGAGTTVTAGAIQGQFNVSSITVNGTGDFTVNFTNAMPDANYAFTGTGSDTPTVNSIITAYYGYILAGSIRLICLNYQAAPANRPLIGVAIFR
jgi:hypothetical protein